MKLSYAWVGFVLMAFIFSFTLNTPLLAQEKEEEVEDVMDMGLEELLNVEITTAGKKAEKISDIPASVVVATRSDIERFGYNTLEDVLENVPGLFGIDQRGAGGMLFGVRGFWTPFANNIIILINGVRQERMSSDGAVYGGQYIPVEAIDRIEVIRGPMSVIYGPGAFFGVINIITNDGKNPGLLSISGGTEKTVKVTARSAYAADDILLVFNAGYYDTAGPDIPISDMSTYDLSSITPYTSTKDKLGDKSKFFNLSGSYKEFYANFTYNHKEKQFYLVFPPSSPDGSHYTRTYSSISFGYKHKFSEQFSLDAKFTYHKGSTRGDFSWFVPEDSNVGGDFNYREDYEVDLTGYFNPSKKLNITGGLFYKKIIYEQLEGVYPYLDLYYRIGMKDPIESRAMFLQADIIPGKSLRFIVGARLEQMMKYSVFYTDLVSLTDATATFEHDKIELIPRIAALFYLNDNSILKLLYGKAINMPSFYNTVAQATSAQPTLNPEYINTVELNYLGAFSEKFTLNISVFYNYFNNLIVNQPYFDPDTGTWVAGYNSNAGELETIGAELTLQAKPSTNFFLELSGTYQKTDDERERFKNIDVAYSPKMLAYLKASYSLSENATLAMTGRYVGAMDTYYTGERVADKVDGYFVLGANLRFNNLFGKGYFLNISGSNLFDTKYYFPSYTLNANWADIGLVGNGRMIMVTVGKKF